MKARDFVPSIVLMLAVTAGILLAYPGLPARIPIHWNVRGHVDGYGPAWMLLAMGPGLMATELAVFAVLPALSPKRFEVDSFRSAYRRIMLAAVAFPAYIVAVVAGAVLTGRLDVTSAILGGVSVLLVVIGNLMGKLRRNFFIGIRTPWTLASERVWYATHRLAGKSIVATGIASLAAALWGGLGGTIAWLALVMAGVTIPVVYSFLHYRALERTGGLEAS